MKHLELLTTNFQSIIPHCAAKQVFIVSCVLFAVLQRGAFVSLKPVFSSLWPLQIIYPNFAQMRPDFTCETNHSLCENLPSYDKQCFQCVQESNMSKIGKRFSQSSVKHFEI